MKNLANLSWIVFIGIISLIVIATIFVGLFSPDTMQQSNVACKHAVEVLTGNQYTIKNVEDGKTSIKYTGFAADKDVICRTSLLRKKIIGLEIGNESRLKDLEHRDLIFNPQLDYFHDH